MGIVEELSRRGQQDENAPTNYGGEQRWCRFIDLERVLEYNG
jgi:hypothetical protein